MADDVEVKVGADIAGFSGQMTQLREILRGLSSPIQGIRQNLGELAEAFVAAFAVEKIEEFVSAMAELGEQTERTAAMLGVSVEKVGELQYVAEMSGVSIDSMSLGMERLGYNMEKAQAGSKMEADAFARLGVSLTDASGKTKSMDEILLETADSFSRHADGVEKSSLALQIFGRAGVQMIPTLDQGRAGMEALMDQADKTGAVLSEQTVKGMVEVQHSIVAMQSSARGAGAELFDVFQPAIKSIVDAAGQIVTRFGDWMKSSYDNYGAMRQLALGVDVVVAGLEIMMGTVEALWTVFSTFLDAAITGFEGLGNVIADAFTQNWLAIKGDASAAMSAIAKEVVGGAENIYDTVSKYGDDIGKMFAATMAPTVVQDKPGAQGLSPFAGPSNLDAAKTKLDALKKSLDEVRSTFQSVFSSIISSVDTAVSGLLEGTKTWQQAMLGLLGSIASEAVKAIEQWVAKWLAGEATMLVAHLTSNDAKEASDVAAQSVSGGEMIANAIKAIFVSSQQTAAGVTANLAPELGPLALPAGIAAGASVAALASFDVGSWELPSDQVAQVHQGEMIVPAAGGMADALRSALSGGGGNPRELAKAIAKELAPHINQGTSSTRQVSRTLRDAMRRVKG